MRPSKAEREKAEREKIEEEVAEFSELIRGVRVATD